MHLAEHQLQDGLERILRGGGRPGWAMLAVHLSRIAGTGPRPYHRRITAALLDDMAERCSGQLFGLGNGDIALLFRPPDDGAAMLTLLARLFHGAVPDPAAVRSLYPLPGAAEAAVAYVRARIQDQADRRPAPPRPEPPAVPVHSQIRAAALPDLVIRRTAVRLSPGTAERIRPIFREIGIADAVLAMNLPGEAAGALGSGTLTAEMDRRVLAAALADLPRGGVITGGTAIPVHLNLTLATIMSEAFARFATAASTTPGMQLGVGVPYSEVFADTAGFVVARERLRLAGMQLVLDQVTHQALAISRPETLDAALMKLGWSPAMAQAPEVVDCLRRFGVARVVLAGCDGEAAVVWGLAHGIQQFQGPFIDGMLAVERLRHCAQAQGCTMAACRDRAATLHLARRAGCRNAALLDAGLDGGAA